MSHTGVLADEDCEEETTPNGPVPAAGVIGRGPTVDAGVSLIPEPDTAIEDHDHHADARWEVALDTALLDAQAPHPHAQLIGVTLGRFNRSPCDPTFGMRGGAFLPKPSANEIGEASRYAGGTGKPSPIETCLGGHGSHAQAVSPISVGVSAASTL